MFAANREYYHQWSVEECHGCSLDLSTFTIEELDNITSEYTLKNTVKKQNPTESVFVPFRCSLQIFKASKRKSRERWKLEACLVFSLGHVLHGRIVLVGESGVRLAPVLVSAAL